MMNKPVHTRTFKSGNSVAVRLPKALGFGPDEELEIQQHGDAIWGRRIPDPAERAERLARWRAALAELQRLGPVGEIELRDPDIFPDRPGL